MKIGKRKHNFIDLTGMIIGRLTVLELYVIKHKRAVWLCKCICGNKITVESTNLIKETVRSCGCLVSEGNYKTHGFTTRKATKIQRKFYETLRGIKRRCFDSRVPAYPTYGGRGIKVEDCWLGKKGFSNFLNDMYESYLKHIKEFGIKNTSLDRFPNKNGNYGPNNTRWATAKEQNNNRRTSIRSDNIDLHKFWRSRLQSLLNSAIRQYQQGSLGTKITNTIFYKYVGLTSFEFRKYIEDQFEPWMNWNNQGPYRKNSTKKVWSIDHILQCYTFDLSTEQDRKDCFNYKNLRPFNAKQNNAERLRELVTI